MSRGRAKDESHRPISVAPASASATSRMVAARRAPPSAADRPVVSGAGLPAVVLVFNPRASSTGPTLRAMSVGVLARSRLLAAALQRGLGYLHEREVLAPQLDAVTGAQFGTYWSKLSWGNAPTWPTR